MDLTKALIAFRGNAESALLTTALHYAVIGKIDLKDMDKEAVAMGVFALVAQLEKEKPGTAERYGWASIEELEAFKDSITGASKAVPPIGLQ
jgi:hypothetical protein